MSLSQRRGVCSWVLALVVGCAAPADKADDAVKRDTRDSALVDTGFPIDTSEDPDPWDTVDDTATFEFSPLEAGFEADLAGWLIRFREDWGFAWGLTGTNEAGDIVLSAGQVNATVSEDTSAVASVEDPSQPMYVILDHWEDADRCAGVCDDCNRAEPITYRAVAGTAELTFSADHADFRLYDLVFEPQFEGDLLNVPSVEGTEVPYRVCGGEPDTN